MKILLMAETKIYKNNRKRRMAWFQCNYCEKVVKRLISAKYQKSCGCLNYKIKHGDSCIGKVKRLYKTWRGMLDRCYNNKLPSYYWYGKKGIKVCNEWLNYINFKNWAIKYGYKNNLTIDRIDSNKDYCPSNCQWITLKENVVKSSLKLNKQQAVEIRNKYTSNEYSYIQLSQLYKVSTSTIANIINNRRYI